MVKRQPRPQIDDRPSLPFLFLSLHRSFISAGDPGNEVGKQKTNPTTLFHDICQITTEFWRSLKLASLASVHILCIPFAAMCSSIILTSTKHNKTMCSEPFNLLLSKAKTMSCVGDGYFGPIKDDKPSLFKTAQLGWLFYDFTGLLSRYPVISPANPCHFLGGKRPLRSWQEL